MSISEILEVKKGGANGKTVIKEILKEQNVDSIFFFQFGTLNLPWLCVSKAKPGPKARI